MNTAAVTAAAATGSRAAAHRRATPSLAWLPGGLPGGLRCRVTRAHPATGSLSGWIPVGARGGRCRGCCSRCAPPAPRPPPPAARNARRSLSSPPPPLHARAHLATRQRTPPFPSPPPQNSGPSHRAPHRARAQRGSPPARPSPAPRRSGPAAHPPAPAPARQPCERRAFCIRIRAHHQNRNGRLRCGGSPPLSVHRLLMMAACCSARGRFPSPRIRHIIEPRGTMTRWGHEKQSKTRRIRAVSLRIGPESLLDTKP